MGTPPSPLLEDTAPGPVGGELLVTLVAAAQAVIDEPMDATGREVTIHDEW